MHNSKANRSTDATSQTSHATWEPSEGSNNTAKPVQMRRAAGTTGEALLEHFGHSSATQHKDTQQDAQSPHGGSMRAPSQVFQMRRQSGLTGQHTLDLMARGRTQDRGVMQCKEGSAGGTAAAGVPNRTGMPDALKAGVEHLSGVGMDDVKVHYNSSKPAQMNALAYAQGTDIHLGPGQEQHLAHESWHVVQQKQGRVAPTKHFKSAPVNDSPVLETEADRMGARALQVGSSLHSQASSSGTSGNAGVSSAEGRAPVQRVISPSASPIQMVVEPGLKAPTKVQKTDGTVVMIIRETEAGYLVVDPKTRRTETLGYDALDPLAEGPPQLPADHLERMAGGMGGETVDAKMGAMTHEVDRLFLEASREAAGTPLPWVQTYSWLALGSYGRREMCPYSDIELGIVFLVNPDDERDADKRLIKESLAGMCRKVLAKLHALAACIIEDSEGNTPSGKGGGGLTGTPAELASSIAVVDAREAVDARHTMLMDARYLAADGTTDAAFIAFQEAKEGQLAGRVGGAEEGKAEEGGGERQADVSARQIGALAMQTLEAAMGDMGSRFLNIKKNFRQPLDWSLMALCIKHIYVAPVGYRERLDALTGSVLVPELAADIRRIYELIFQMRIDLHTHHHEELDVVDVAPDREGEEGGFNEDKRTQISSFEDVQPVAEIIALFNRVGPAMLELLNNAILRN